MLCVTYYMSVGVCGVPCVVVCMECDGVWMGHDVCGVLWYARRRVRQGVYCVVCDDGCRVCGVWCIVYDVYCVLYVVWCVSCGVWRIVLCVVVCDVWVGDVGCVLQVR